VACSRFKKVFAMVLVAACAGWLWLSANYCFALLQTWQALMHLGLCCLPVVVPAT
jgi:hypothetical protein